MPNLGMNEREARRKRQSEVSKAGRETERRIMQILAEDDRIRKECIIGHGPSQSVRKKFVVTDFETGESIELPHYILSVRYTNESGKEVYLYMDADIVVYHKPSKRIICVISSKKSFRERGAQSAYWALKKRDRNYKYILVTPDHDNELFKPEKPYHQGKWRTILENELDAVFVIDKEPPFKSGNFYVGNEYLKGYVRAITNNF